MARRFGFGIDLQTAGSPRGRRADPDAPMRLLLVGDFSARGEVKLGEAATFESRQILSVDSDNFDRMLARQKPSARVAIPGAPALELSMPTLDDFHPTGCCVDSRCVTPSRTCARGYRTRCSLPRPQPNWAFRRRLRRALPPRPRPCRRLSPSPAW